MGKSQHVVPQDGDWVVVSGSNDRATSNHGAKAAAIGRVRAIRERRRKQRHNQHVIPFDNGWAVREEGKTRPTKICQTQKDAIGAARVIAIRDRASVVIHSRDGRIRERESYGADPYPPKEMRTVLLPVTDTVTDPKKIREAVNEVIQESRKTS